MTDLNGKVALVTGGSRGIGAAIARRLAADGARVAITYTSQPAAAEAVVADIESRGGRALALRADNRDSETLAAAVREAADALGGLDILVNNAGIFEMRPISELTLEDYRRVMEVNTQAVFVATRAAVDLLPEGGRVINLGSSLAVRVPWAGLTLYSMSKAALIGFTKALARDLGERGITANVVHPGSTDTDMNPAGGDHADGQRALMAIPRYNDPDHLAALVSWLAGPEARSVTGSEFAMDGGANI
ncbi:SDR family NAD(P)-dependent oxidoreductase [Alloalcanivorax xenomutans]|jgi:3-oxoacyl-[acyl-carrier protein] reductase|uniref:SDR family oxidoreductase n=1 Tax=Alloalcanivorax xenomutans TaxID=1094342 RepID=A0A9Q3W1V4_9GAMM|nr:SDR family oxidoreductase [Alloalcanivorax xenomutans]ERS13640.1 hypothetical protein Q668_14025 [Alcanivorax sp. PN-3]MBA4721593.1 SDR family oxidoreductase [Alcanivorax sp.]ARB45096.1 oxidoreductase [Alloalcanivorax xenomutans]MCE7509105.1 SDR family oxidoreductase [Alloalcanivorax xenomutans]PHS60290.1 MAG: SDR family oxidoreductase [Alcanivorax sp.]